MAAWVESARHTGVYTGGKVGVTGAGRELACLKYGDVAFVDLSTGLVTRELQGKGDENGEEFTTFALHPSRPHVVVAAKSLLIGHWVAEAGGETRRLRQWKGHAAPVTAAEYDPSGVLVATASSDKTVKVWNVAGGYCTHNFTQHGCVVAALRFHPDPQRLRLASGDISGTVLVADL